ncbi:MAG: hypothetical protein V7K98_23930 [Nostoc sp.]|uniref:hypothetical protein n=1 Tax=Nostoc sp. TaxID=1180 RepID=UPI002FF5A5DA
MTVNLNSVHPSTVSIPAPLFNLGQLVTWNCETSTSPVYDSFEGVVVQQSYRNNWKGGSWGYTMAITVAKRHGIIVDLYVGDFAFDIQENDLTNDDRVDPY